ncbi:MAG: transcription-repair coupling factor [Clostridia bacterium]|nr:transcription-repair coupling factor [Clostridia bacterium]
MQHLNRLPEFNSLAADISSGKSGISVSGVTSSARADLIHTLLDKTQKSAFVVAENMYDAKILYEDLCFYHGSDNVVLFPAKDYIFYNIETAALRINNDRLAVIDRILNQNDIIVVAPLDAVLQYTVPKEIYSKYLYEIKPGSRLNFDELTHNLAIMGYKRSDCVEGVGQMNFRGGILDIFPPTYENPIRIEFFDDEVETIRFFDAASQISQQTTDFCRITCCRELIYDDVTSVIEKINKYPKTDWTNRDIDRFEEEHYFPSADRYLPFIYENVPSVLSYLNKDFILFLDYPPALSSRAEAYEKEMGSILTQFAENDSMPLFNGSYLCDINDIIGASIAPIVTISDVSADAGFINIAKSYEIDSRSLPSYNGRIDLIIEDIKNWKQNNYFITILAGTKAKATAFKQTLEENGVFAELCNEFRFADNENILIVPGSLSSGFEYPALNSVVISSAELFGKAKHRSKANTMPGIKIKSYADLSVGDYVVHQVHGIGEYLGMHRMEVDGIIRDYLKIEYKDTDVLYVPATSLDTVNKYVSNDGKKVKLNKMGGLDFAKVKKRVVKALEDIADELVALYAERSTKKGFSFSPDNDWQQNFEQMFPYEETADQLKSIEEAKADMESDKPMDRLLCGDVGYGKTEVALRCAFKAVMDSKQVAYLVPTTILAQQHYNTFVERMKEYPINVEMLSRFRTPKQQKEIIKKLSTGEVDIIIGTHKILQKDVVFKDLGLLIIDEEQRFGVKHKEQIKELKKDVDVLTLSATPIPRTLHMSLTGIRDMSVIAEPPEDRYPVQTFVLEYDRETVRDAILKELGRNGQVYYVYNRVEGIFKVANMLQELAPNAKIAVAHGQMSERELESVLMDTVNGDVDILVCTTIIETGLDIPNINTIIIENADCMGLSQLYQLRGRVGRSNRIAYAYLTYRKDKALNETAIKRLSSIREFTEFGSGFKIAMRDLEIRGAGNLLGAAQHGEMDAVGYDMYCKLLDEAVAKTKGIEKPEEIITTVDIKVDTFISDKYIPSHNIKLEMYKKIASAASETDKEDLIDELIDRFGEPPQSVINLIDVSLIRELANKAQMTDVIEKGPKIYMYFDAKAPINPEKIAKVAATFRGRMFFNSGGRPFISFTYSSKEKCLSELKAVLNHYNSLD